MRGLDPVETRSRCYAGSSIAANPTQYCDELGPVENRIGEDVHAEMHEAIEMGIRFVPCCLFSSDLEPVERLFVLADREIRLGPGTRAEVPSRGGGVFEAIEKPLGIRRAAGTRIG